MEIVQRRDSHCRLVFRVADVDAITIVARLGLVGRLGPIKVASQ
jgi:hypothetical protein